MKLTDAIRKDLESARVFVEFANRETIKIWNSMRAPNEPVVFGGWYWFHGYREGGPFRCESAAMRDAWYRFCLKREPPTVFATRHIHEAMKVRQAGRPPLRIVG